MPSESATAVLSRTHDLADINRTLASRSPDEIVRWSLDYAAGNAVVSTNFRPLSAVTLHLVTRAAPQAPVVWVDTGYNTPSTYRFADRLTRALDLNLKVYIPTRTAAFRDALNGGIPSVYDEEPHRAFTREVKLEPFRRAMDELRPVVWFHGLRRSQSEFRASLDIATLSSEGILKISPVYAFTDADMEAYLATHGLPDEKDYFDPTKALEKRECGLHLTDSGL